MTDDLSRYGLGALPDPPDERDYPVSALYAAEGLTASVTLPASYTAPGMPPVLDQHATPMRVACSSSAMKAWQDRRDQERYFDFDEPAFFASIGGTAQGAYVRAAVERMPPPQAAPRSSSTSRRSPGRRVSTMSQTSTSSTPA